MLVMFRELTEGGLCISPEFLKKYSQIPPSSEIYFIHISNQYFSMPDSYSIILKLRLKKNQCILVFAGLGMLQTTLEHYQESLVFQKVNCSELLIMVNFSVKQK